MRRASNWQNITPCEKCLFFMQSMACRNHCLLDREDLLEQTGNAIETGVETTTGKETTRIDTIILDPLERLLHQSHPIPTLGLLLLPLTLGRALHNHLQSTPHLTILQSHTPLTLHTHPHPRPSLHPCQHRHHLSLRYLCLRSFPHLHHL